MVINNIKKVEEEKDFLTSRRRTEEESFHGWGKENTKGMENSPIT